MDPHPTFKFRLYVVDGALNSAQADKNLTTLCQAHLPGRHAIEIVDVFKEPRRALADRIFMTPTLVKLGPHPVRWIVGTLSHTQTVMRALGLDAPAA